MHPGCCHAACCSGFKATVAAMGAGRTDPQDTGGMTATHLGGNVAGPIAAVVVQYCGPACTSCLTEHRCAFHHAHMSMNTVVTMAIADKPKVGVEHAAYSH